MAVRFTHQEKESCRVPADFVQNLFQGDKLAAALSHTNGLAAARELYHLHQHDLQEIRIVTKSLHRRLQARYVAVMVGSPDIDQFSKPALVFVSMICDVAGKISELPVAFDNRSVLIIAKLRRFVPF